LFEAFAVTCPRKQSEAVASWGSVSSQFSYELFEGALEALSGLKSHGFRLHLWTARDQYSARKILKELGIETFFTTMSFATEADSKPNANSLRFSWREAEKNQVMVIGDSATDIIGARNIAAVGAAALWDPHSARSSLVAAGAELFFYNMKDFQDWMVGAG
jgi:HAD superfamily hydrolase (TIGR01549 family)